jgi:hypothetical protein
MYANGLVKGRGQRNALHLDLTPSSHARITPIMLHARVTHLCASALNRTHKQTVTQDGWECDRHGHAVNCIERRLAKTISRKLMMEPFF